MKLQELKLDQRLQAMLAAQGYAELYPPQAAAIEQGVLDGKNLVLAVPTASGKTLVAIFAMLKAILAGRGRALYLVPLRALASEKYREFKSFESLGVRVAYSTGDLDSADTHLGQNDLIVTTNEKADSLLRHHTTWMRELAVVVSDEVHLINDADRGPTLEVVLAKLRAVNPHAQFLALSATIRNADEIAKWLDAGLVTSEWRPVTLREGVFAVGQIEYEDGGIETLPPARRGVPEALILALRAVERGKQALVFVNSRQSTQAFAKEAASELAARLTKTETRALSQLAEKIGRTGERTRLGKALASTVINGAAFHHAGLSPEHRELVENAFREAQIKILSASPTLAAGVNLPAETVVVRDYRRYEGGLGFYPIPVLEYKQMSGRAGRPRYDKQGFAYLVAKTPEEKSFLLDKYIRGPPEKIWSKLASEPALRMHLLATITTGFAHDQAALQAFVKGTFYSQQYDPEDIDYVIQRALSFLIEEDFIRPRGTQLDSTPFGLRTTQLYIDPKSATIVREAIQHSLETQHSIEPVGLFQLIAHTPDMEDVYLRKGDYEKYNEYVDLHKDEFILPPPDQFIEPAQYEFFLSEVKTGTILLNWIDEVPEDDIIGEYKIGSGDILRLVSTAEWLLHAIAELAALLEAPQMQRAALLLERRVKNGCKAELLPLIDLPNIGRVRGRILFNAGYINLEKIVAAPVEELANLPLLGVEIAQKIKEHLGQDVSSELGLRLKPPKTLEPDSGTQDTLSNYDV